MADAPRKVLVLSGKRGGYGAMKPMLRLLRDDPKIELQLVLTDQHVDARFGNTIDEVRREFPVAATVPLDQADDRPVSRAEALGRALEGLSRVMAELAPDICVLYGDRGEVLAAATAATVLGIPIAHVQGGDVSGSTDDQMRHALTKLAQLHFPSNAESAERIRRMGEEDWRITVVGDNHIDLIVAGEFARPDAVAAELELNLAEPVVTVLQHSETTAPEAAYGQMVETLAAVRDTGCQAVVVYPCSDPGYRGVIQAIEEIAAVPQFRVRVNLDAPMFWGLLNVSSVMVGNSSAGLIETPYFGLPAINVGRRQIGRLHSTNVSHVPHERARILDALNRAIGDPAARRAAAACEKLFGDGRAGERIVAALKQVALDERLRVKQLTY